MLIGKHPYETSDVKKTYEKIRMNILSFPDHAPISDNSKNLITQILNSDPSKRPDLDEILDHPFMNSGGLIPKVLPLSSLTCGPSANNLK